MNPHGRSDAYGAFTFLIAHRYEEAIDWATRASSLPNCQYWRIPPGRGAGQYGHIAQDRTEVPDLLEQCPGFSVDYADAEFFYLKRADQRELYLARLPAGVPEGTEGLKNLTPVGNRTG